jgi:hypothetical protein
LPPETLAWRDRSWGSSVEVTFGIGSSWFSFVSYEHFGNNIHSHYLPVAQNVTIFYQTTNITHYHINDGQVFVGGPSYLYVCDRIGETFPVHNLKLNQDPVFSHQLSNHFSGQDLEVVAPLMDADWNTALSPESIEKDLGEVSVERSVERSDDVRERFRESRATEALRGQKAMANVGGQEELQRVSRRTLEENRERVRLAESGTVVDAEVPAESTVKVTPNRRGQLSRESTEDRSERPRGNRSVPEVREAPVISSSTPDPGQAPEPVVPRRPDFIPQRNNPQLPPGVIPAPETAEKPPGIEPPSRPDRIALSDRGREGARLESGEETSQQAKRRETMERLEQRKMEEQRQRDRQERAMLHQQQQQAAEVRRDLDRRKSQELAEQRIAQEEANRSAQQQQIRQQEEAVRRARQQNDQNAQQEEIRRQEQQGRIRQQQEQAARGAQQEEARRQQEAQQEGIRQQEEAKRQQEEVARRAQQEEVKRAQNEEAARGAQQERARQQQEEAQRRQQEEAKRQQEEVARRA